MLDVNWVLNYLLVGTIGSNCKKYVLTCWRVYGDNFRIDACESKVEIVTPYWASNSAGKIRAIVNTQHFEQAIHQEVCS